MAKIAQEYTLGKIYSNLSESPDYFTGIAEGLYENKQDYRVFGINFDIDTGTAEDIWGYGGTFVPPTTARKHDIVSTSVNDTSAGSGTRTLRVYGITVNGFETEDITMNGLVNVTTIKSYFDIYKLEILTYGVDSTNDGIITATAQTDATVTISMQVTGLNTTTRAVRYIPSGYTGYLYDWSAGMYQATATSTADVYLLIRTNGIWVATAFHSLSNTGNSLEKDDFLVPLVLQSETWIKMRCTSVSSNNTIVQGLINLILVKNK